MVRAATRDQIEAELEELARVHGDPVPLWDLIGGTTSVFIHPIGPFTCPRCGPPVTIQFEEQTVVLRCPGCGMIFFSIPVLEEFERTNDEVDLIGLVAHEFWHWHQFVNNINQDRPQVREANARRFTKQWISERFPGREDELNFQAISPALAALPREPGIRVDGQEIEVPKTVAEQFPQATPEDLLFLEESFKPIGRPPPVSTSRWIRFKFLRDGENYPYRMWTDYRDFMARFDFDAPSYQGFRRMIWMVNRLGLIRMERVEEAKFGVRHFYMILEDQADDLAWNNPQQALYG